jgi:hypothetical protein
VVVLADGSKVSLDAATRVDVSYRHDGRALRLEQGRAKFDVAKDPLRPFAVAAGDETVVATGTEFSVELVRRQVRVVLYEGHVAVLGPASVKGTPQPVRLAARAAPADQLLVPGRELVMNASAQVATVAAADPVRTLAWEGGQLVFVDEPLATGAGAGHGGLHGRRHPRLRRGRDRRFPGAHPRTRRGDPVRRQGWLRRFFRGWPPRASCPWAASSECHQDIPRRASWGEAP